jgi:uncharacterized cupin superfamily protein
MKFLLAILFASLFTFAANAQDSPFRKELKRADLTGTNMEIITSISEIKPGDTSTLHIHHGDESYYVLEGGTIELPDGKQVPIPIGIAAVSAGYSSRRLQSRGRQGSETSDGAHRR